MLQVVESLLGIGQLELGSSVVGVGGIPELDDGVTFLDGLAFLGEDLADDAAGGEGDVGEADGFEASFGDDRIVCRRCRCSLRCGGGGWGRSLTRCEQQAKKNQGNK
jgi:hypothetical protein